jgi:glycosyltransferase involved in cell wall biosynthesis
VVSAHYPPNFVSGGTLVPQRIAHGLAARGWRVGVYAGWLGADRPPYQAWDSDDGDGVTLRWIATFFGWDDRRNFDNPPVADDFGAWLDRWRPGVVNFHSLQTLGAGLVDEACRRRLPVVVTLHDFWWWCARQFMVTTDYQPCCPVLDASTCPCQVDRHWLEERRRYTMAALARADRVVAVSEICARVAEANGVDPARLEVVENGVVPAGAGPRPPVRNPAPGSDRPAVRFIYAGGPDPMKGGFVLLEAARRVAARGAWSLRCYGCQDWAADLNGLPAEALPPFPPEGSGDVFAAGDVLVVPSVMRETYSILTREALSHGVPVITSDCLGPEEVVADGLNGMIVPTGDPSALAEAMTRVVDDPGLLGELRRGTSSSPLPSVDAQIDRMEEILAGVSSRTVSPAAAPERPRVSKVLFVVGIDGAPLRYRAHLPAEALRELGTEVAVRHYRHPDISRLGEEADVVVVYRVPATVQIAHFLAGVRRLGTPILFDVDDLIFDPDLYDEIPALRILDDDEAALWMQGVRRYRTTMEQCDGFVGSTAMLCRHATAVTGLPSWRFRNGVGAALGRLSDEALGRPRAPGPLRIGYLSGTNTHDHDWRYIEPAVADVLESHPQAELWLVGLVAPSPALAAYRDRVRVWPLMDWRRLPTVLRDLDVNLAPMEPGSRFNEAKSAIKWLEAALVATPTVASPTEPYREVIRAGVNGVLAGDHTDWAAAISRLLDDDLARRRLANRARRDALLEFAPAVQGRRYLSILEEVRPRASGGSGWEPEWLDEPFIPVDLEPYPGLPPGTAGGSAEAAVAEGTVAEVAAADAGVDPRAGETNGVTRGPGHYSRRMAVYAGAVRRSIHDEGWAATATRSARYLSRRAAAATRRRR